jgi:hypothetical protein
MNRALASALAVLVLAAPVMASAAEPPQVTTATATRLADGKVELAVTFDGGACEETSEAQVEASESDEAVDTVIIPTVATAEICTQQIVPVEFSGVIAVETLTTRLAITVLDPAGQPKATGSVEIGPVAN